MARTLVGIGAAITALGLSVALTASPALAAVDDGTWGIWTSEDVDDAPIGTLVFGNTAGATYEYTEILGDSTIEIATVNDKEMWLAASSAPGAVFGANGPSDIENLIDLDADEGASSPATATFVVTFDAEVPANDLGFVIMDIDSENTGEAAAADRVLIEATNAAGNNLTSSEINGEVFNFCNVPLAEMPGDCEDTTYTEVPTMTEPTATSVFFQGDLSNSGDDGDSGWVNPTAAVKTLTLNWDTSEDGSSIKLAIAVKKPTLANTGLDVTTGALSALVLGALGAVAVIASRRRNA
jgi:hypothetical protein